MATIIALVFTLISIALIIVSVLWVITWCKSDKKLYNIEMLIFAFILLAIGILYGYIGIGTFFIIYF